MAVIETTQFKSNDWTSFRLANLDKGAVGMVHSFWLYLPNGLPLFAEKFPLFS
jgi:hypothetical protein